MRIPPQFRITTAGESRQIDADTTEQFGIGSYTLMETAGATAARHLYDTAEAGSRGVFLCGKGNNGGDALVVARWLAQHDVAVTLVFVGGTGDLSPDAQTNYGLLQQMAEHDEDADITFIEQWEDFDTQAPADFVIDGLLGTGLDSDLRGDFTDAVAWANTQQAPVYAMDIPTGLHSDTGEVMGDAIAARRTFAFGTLKLGYYLAEGKTRCGEITFCELPFPRHISEAHSAALIDDAILPESSNKKARHKYEAGVLHIIAGSEGLTGAALMAAQSAWAEGVGAVVLICPRGTLQVFENNLPQIIKKPVGSRDDVFFREEHTDQVLDIVAEKDGPVLVGPGMGRHDSTVAFINRFLAENEHDAVIDADGLWALAQHDEWQRPSASEWIITPHPGELGRLTDRDIEGDAGRLEAVRELAAERDLTLLSKGWPVLVGTSSGETYITGYDTRIFSRAGFGDVLAGKTGAFLAMDYAPAESSVRALLNGKAKADHHHQTRRTPLEPLDLV